MQNTIEAYLEEVKQMNATRAELESLIAFFKDPRVAAIDTAEKLCEVMEVSPDIFDFPPSVYQLCFFKTIVLPYIYEDLPKFGTRLTAVAGSGKSFCIVKAAELLKNVSMSIAVVCFNVKIRDEMRSKLRQRGLHTVYCNNLHSIGFKMLRDNLRNHWYAMSGGDVSVAESRGTFKVEPSKVTQYIAARCQNFDFDAAKKVNPQFAMKKYKSNLRKLINLGRAFVISSKSDLQGIALSYNMPIQYDEIVMAFRMIKLMSTQTGLIDQTDMVYLPNKLSAQFEAKMNGSWSFTQYDLVMVDEAQDLSTSQLGIVKRMIRPNGRIVAVGDEQQGITAFAGADIYSWANIGKLPNMVDLPLTISYRCPQGTERLVNHHVPAFKVFDQNPEGIFPDEDRNASLADVKDGSMILCRNSAPLVGLCLLLISKGRKANVLGFELGVTLSRVIEKHAKKNHRNLDFLFRSIEAEIKKNVSNLMQTLKMDYEDAMEHADITMAYVQLDSIRYLAKGCKSVQEVLRNISQVFSKTESQGITLMTGHKSKGLEADDVYILDPHLLPAKYAKTAEALRQEANLNYVMHTRHKRKIAYLLTDEIDATELDTKKVETIDFEYVSKVVKEEL